MSRRRTGRQRGCGRSAAATISNSRLHRKPQDRIEWSGKASRTPRCVPCVARRRSIVFGAPLGVNLFRPTGRLYFPVPAGVEQFALQVAGVGTAETVKATLRDSSGNIVDVQDNIALPHVFLLQRSASTRPKSGPLVWRKPPKASWKMCPSRHSGSRPFLPCRRDMSLRFPAENPSRPNANGPGTGRSGTCYYFDCLSLLPPPCAVGLVYEI